MVPGLSTVSSSSSSSATPTSLPQESTGSLPIPASVDKYRSDEQEREKPFPDPGKNSKPKTKENDEPERVTSSSSEYPEWVQEFRDMKNETHDGVTGEITVTGNIEYNTIMNLDLEPSADQNNSDLRTDAAAAITYRDTYAFYAYMSNAGNERDPATKVFEAKTWTDAFSKFPVFRLLGYGGVANHSQRTFRSPRHQHAAQALELNDAMLIEGANTYPTGTTIH